MLVLLLLILMVAGGGLLMNRMEGKGPQLQLELTTPSIGKTKTLSVSVSDEKSGVRRFWIGLVKDGKEIQIASKTFPSAGFFSGGMVRQETIEADLDTDAMGISDGKAVLRIAVWDYSWRNWGKGNRTYIEKEILVDTKPPTIAVLSISHNIAQGGSAMIVYKVSEDCPESGVLVGDVFFPGYKGYFDDEKYVAFFALNYEQGSGTSLRIKATDYAGNTGATGFPYHIRSRKFRKDRINISDGFLNAKLPEFENQLGPQAGEAPVDRFLKINRDIRKANAERVFQITAVSQGDKLWEGSFLRLPKSASRAQFADHRGYFYKGKSIDKQVHLGVDLASVAHSPVPASNSGKVVFAEYLGIYGNSVILDHGLGVFSMYAHLSAIEVETGQMVSKGDNIGKTGRTGLAGGDHLHFSMLVNKTFVDPVEWWDQNWIKNNISDKFLSLKSK